MNPVGSLAQSGVVLLDKVPANLILGEIVVGTGGVDGFARHRTTRVGSSLVLLLVHEAAVRSHGCLCRLVWQDCCDAEGVNIKRARYLNCGNSR